MQADVPSRLRDNGQGWLQGGCSTEVIIANEGDVFGTPKPEVA
jgi:hypothetical protein